MQQVAPSNQDIARFQPEAAPDEQKKPWERMKNEPARWFLRFQIYRNLGSKRSLRATIAAETEAQPATKSNRKPRATKDTENLSDVSVPGSWSRAAKVWNWKERATAWDLDQLHQRGKRYQKSVGNCEFASRVTRIQYLNSLIQGTQENLRNLKALDQHMMLMKLQQSLLKQIAEEMSVFDALDQTELDGRVACSLWERAEERQQQKSAKQQTSAQTELERRRAEPVPMNDAEFAQLLAEGKNMLEALGERKH